ncbi:MAG: SGNH/GDSL hydrolase family protein [Clostridia bacterium]|nr:SGNH/GDSL hydrolase family protein [Clostridia bacterium]
MKTILFQGDSITDCGRDKSYDTAWWNEPSPVKDGISAGHGYARFVEAQLGVDYPNEYGFINRGISGNRVVDIYARINKDIINLKPDYMSILVGVNDVWHGLDGWNGVDADKHFMIYSLMIEEIKSALPDIKIMILEPFLLKATATENNWELFRGEVEKRAEKSRLVAEKYGLKFVPLMSKFDEAAKLAPASYWSADGVHPTAKGHEIIKREWIKAFEEIK